MKVLKHEHPTMIKVEKVFKLMSELGIQFEACDYGVMRVKDENLPYTKLMLKEQDSDFSPPEMPPTFDYRIVVEE